MQTLTDQEAPAAGPESITAISWTSRIPVLTNPFVWWDALRVLVISLLALELMVALMGFLVDGEVVLLPPIVWLIVSGVLAGLFVLAGLLMRNRVWARFTLDRKRARYESIPEMDAYERTVNVLVKGILVVFSGLRGLGAQVFGASAVEEIDWSNVHKVTVHHQERVVTLSNSWRSVLRLYCLPDEFEMVVAFVQARAAEGAARRARRAARKARSAGDPSSRTPRPWWLYLVWSVLSLAAAIGCSAWEWGEYRGAGRVGLIAGILTLLVGLSASFWWSKLLALLAMVGDVVFLGLLTAEALETFRPLGGGAPVRTYTLDTPLFVVSVVSGLVLLALGICRWKLQDHPQESQRKPRRQPDP